MWRVGRPAGPYRVDSAPFTANADGTITVTLAAGDDVVITTAGTAPDLSIAPVAGDGKRYWGLP